MHSCGNFAVRPGRVRAVTALPPRDDSSDGRAEAQTRAIVAADALRESILAGAVRPGTRINEVQLSQRLGVSRTPTRAALHALAAEGLLDYVPNRGFTVRAYAPETIAQAYEIRAVLEGLACRFAAERRLDTADRDRFARALADGDAVVQRFDGTPRQMEAYRKANVAFHAAVLTAARNRMLEDALRLALTRPAATLRNIVAFTEAQVRRRHDDHHRIHEAIAAGDGWRAELWMREHVTSVKAIQLAQLRG